MHACVAVDSFWFLFSVDVEVRKEEQSNHIIPLPVLHWPVLPLCKGSPQLGHPDHCSNGPNVADYAPKSEWSGGPYNDILCFC